MSSSFNKGIMNFSCHDTNNSRIKEGQQRKMRANWKHFSTQLVNYNLYYNSMNQIDIQWMYEYKKTWKPSSNTLSETGEHQTEMYLHFLKISWILHSISRSKLGDFRLLPWRWDEICAILVCYTAYSGNSLPAFQDNISVPSSRGKNQDRIDRFSEILLRN